MISLVLDVLVAGLLAGTIYFCWILNQKLEALRGDRAELERLIASLNDATGKAAAGIEELKANGEQIAGRLAAQVKQGRGLTDELSLIMEAGNNLADRLANRPQQGPVAVKLARSEPEAPAGQHEPALLRALREVR